MRRFRQIALVILFGGWMLPAFLAQGARDRAPRSTSHRRPPVQVLGDAPSPPPAPAERLASMFGTIAVIWFVIALIYAGVLTLRLRRTLVR